MVQSRTYFIFFNTILEELFIHNLLTKGYDWVNSNLYNLPPSAQIFYRRFILHHNYHRIELTLDTILKKMNFTDKNHTNLLCRIEGNTLEHFKMDGLILSYEKKEALEGLKYVITLPEKGTPIRDGMEGPEKGNRFKLMKLFWISKQQYI